MSRNYPDGPIRRIDLQNHVILVQLREQRGDLPLAEGIVQRIVEILRGEPQAGSRGSIEFQRGLTTVVLLVAGDILEFRKLPQPVDEAVRVGREFGRIGVLHAVLVFGAAHDVFHRDVLNRLHVQIDSLDIADRGLQFANDLRR